MIQAGGGFVLVWVATPIEVCERRDHKGLYAKARAGKIANFTGVSDPYEKPTEADLVLDTTHLTPEECAQAIVLHLERDGYIRRLAIEELEAAGTTNQNSSISTLTHANPTTL